MAQVRAEMFHIKQLKNAEKNNKLVKSLRVALPVGNYNDDDDDNDDGLEPPKLDIDELNDISDDETNNNEIGNSSNFSQKNSETNEFIKFWFDMLNDEDENNNEELVNNEENDEENDISSEILTLLLGRCISPADSNEAKWELSNLFNSSLESPNNF